MLDLLCKNQELANMMYDICDVDIFSQFKNPNDADGRLTFSLAGQAFARDGAGSEYIVFEDDSVGIYDSEGKCGRIADSLQDFFEFMVNCPFWRDYIRPKSFCDIETLREFADETFGEHCEMAQEELDIDLVETQKELANKMQITLHKDVAQDILMKFYTSATRSPQIMAAFQENGGNSSDSSGSLFAV